MWTLLNISLLYLLRLYKCIIVILILNNKQVDTKRYSRRVCTSRSNIQDSRQNMMESSSNESNQFSQNFQQAFELLAALLREIADQSIAIGTKLQRTPVDTSNQVLALLQETLTNFKSITDRVLTVSDILRTQIDCYCSISEDQELEVTTYETLQTTEESPSSKQEPLNVTAPFSVKLPSAPKVDKHVQSKLMDLSLSKYVSSQTPIKNSLPPPRNISQADAEDRNPLEDGKVMVRADSKIEDEEHSSLCANNLGSVSLSSFLSSTMWTTNANSTDLDTQRQQVVQTEDAFELQALKAETDGDDHTIEWLADLYDTGGADDTVRYKWLVELLFEETLQCMKRTMLREDFSFRDTEPPLEYFADFINEVDQEVERIKQSQCLPVRGNGPDTILCLDTSASMHGENFRKMAAIANQIIDDIEELSNFEVMHGNIAVTTFGIQSRVALHLTNDYPHVRNVIDSLIAEGQSELHQGLSMSFAACIGNYADVSVNGVRLMARIIVITDGKFSAEDAKDENFEFDPTNAILVPSVANTMKVSGLVCYCVQIGASADSELLQILTKTTNGKIFPDDHVDELTRMSKHLFVATRLLCQFPDLVERDKEAMENKEATLHALMDLESSSREALGGNFSKPEKETVVGLAINISNLPLTKAAEINEYIVQELDLQLPPVGTRVRRGPDWNPSFNQDSNGPGTVVSHNNNGTVAVLWDSGIFPLPYCCYDPCQILSTDKDERMARDDGWIQVGCKVIRGPGWTHGDDDGGQGSCGVVCLWTRNGTVTVRWPSKKIGKYKYGDEVILKDTTTEQAQAAGYEVNRFPIEYEPGNKSTLSSNIRYHPKPYKNLNFRRYYTSARNSNIQFLMSGTLDYPLKPELRDSVPEIRSISESPVLPDSILEVESNPELDESITSVWSFQQENEVEWIPFDACNTRKLEFDWSKHRKTTMVSVNDKSYRVVFLKMTMHSSGSKTDGKQLKIQREQKCDQNTKDTFD